MGNNYYVGCDFGQGKDIHVYAVMRKSGGHFYHVTDNVSGYTLRKIKEYEEARLNRKWQRIFAGLIILNAIIWYNILTQ